MFGLLEASVVAVKVAVKLPVPGGEKAIFAVQNCPGPSGDPQVELMKLKIAELVSPKLVNVSVPAPVFVKVAVKGALCDPRHQLVHLHP